MHAGVVCSVAVSLHENQVGECERRTPFERLGDAFGLSSPGRALCSARLHLVTLSGGDLPLFSSLLCSQPCQADSQMPSWLMFKPNSWRREDRDKSHICIEREFGLLHVIWDSSMIFQ